jgi:hypothetical protein
MPDVKTAEKPEAATAPEPQPAAAPVAAEPTKPALQPGNVWCRILPNGHNKVSTGETKRNATGGYDMEEGAEVFPKFPRGAIMQLPLKIAKAQEINGNLEIQED